MNGIGDQLKQITESGDKAGKFASRVKDGCLSRIFLYEDILDEGLGAAEDVVQHELDGQF